MRKHLSLGDRADTSVAIPERTEDSDVVGVGFKPEAVLQGPDRDHAFDHPSRTRKEERDAATGEHLRGNCKRVHGNRQGMR